MGALHLEAAFICYLLTSALAQDEEWKSATATFSKETDASIETEGACGFGDLHKTRYGKYSVGLSGMLFDRGSSCGACFQVRCVDHNQKQKQWCIQGNPSITLTATDFCPPNYALPADYGGWCNFPRAHFQIPEPAFSFLQVLVANVGLDGAVVAVKVKGSRTGWIPMARNWGQNWQCNINLAGQPLSFEVTTAGRRTLASYSVAPPTWNFGQTFTGKQF